MSERYFEIPGILVVLFFMGTVSNFWIVLTLSVSLACFVQAVLPTLPQRNNKAKRAATPDVQWKRLQ